MSNNFFKLSFVAVAVAFSLNGYAQRVNLDNFYYRDYLDFGNNKGAFSPNNNGLHYAGINGQTMNFEHIPDFSSRSNEGNVLSFGRNFAVSMMHFSDRVFDSQEIKQGTAAMSTWGNTHYVIQTGKQDSHSVDTRKLYGRDTLYFRTNKYIVEGNAAPMDVSLDKTSNFLDQKNQRCKNLSEYNQKKECLDHLFAEKQDIKKPLNDYITKFDQFYQAGSGIVSISGKYAEVPAGETKTISANATNGGSVHLLNKNNQFNIVYDDGEETDGRKTGFTIKTQTTDSFQNAMTLGDSGSALMAYDKDLKKWVVVGVLSEAEGGGLSWWSPTLAVDLKDYKKQYEHQMTSFEQTQLQKDKDNIFKTAGTLTLSNDLDLASGGLVFTNNQNYNITGGNLQNIAGIDIEQGSSLTLNSTVNGDLHKVGQGTLTVENATGGNLRFGNGLVNINNAEAFKKIYITGQDAVLKLNHDFKIADKVFFGKSGGTLDVNGFNQELSHIASNNNNGTQLINSNSQLSTLTFAPNQQTIIHTPIGGAENNYFNITTNNSQDLAFDGGFNIAGDLNLQQGHLTLQGHPTTHDYIKNTGKKPDATGPRPKTPCYLDKGENSTVQEGDKISQLNREAKDYFIDPNNACLLERMSIHLPDYMDLSRPSTLAQPDWDNREYHVQNIQLQANTHLNIGKDAKVFAENLQATKAKIIIGGNQFKHFIDKNDGENTVGNGFKYQQQVETSNLDKAYRGYLEAKNIQLNNSQLTAYNADIVGQHLTLQNNAHIALNDHSQLTLEALDLAKDHNISTDDSSLLSVKTLNVPNQAVKLAAHTYIQTKLTVKAGDHTALTTSGKTIHLEKDASFDMAIEDELKNLAVDAKKTITFEHLDDQRANKDEVNFSQLPAETYFTYQYDSDKNQMILTRVAKDPTSKDNLQDILNGNANNNVDSPISNPSENNPQPDSTTPSGPGDSAKPSQPTENKPASALDNQLLDLLMASENQITSLKQQLDDIGRNENKDRPALLNLIRRTEQDFNTLGKQEWLLNKVNFLSTTIGDEQSENLWLSSGYAGNKLKTQHLMLGTNFHYGSFTLGAAIGQFKVKKDNQDADVTVLSGKLVKNLANNWAIHSHLTGLWANNKLDFYSESLKSNQHSRYKEYGLNVDVQAAYTYGLTPHLSLMPKFGLGYSFAQQNQVQTQDFRKAKQHYQLLNVLAGVALDYQVKQASFGALVNVAQPFLLSGKEQKLGFKNNADYRVNAENPKTLVKFGLQGRYAFSNNVNINAESGISSLSSFYLNLGLGYRF